MIRLLAAILSILALAPAALSRAEVPFSAEQAARGKILYMRQCGFCHGPKLWDGAASPLVGSDFLAVWGADGKSLQDLYEVTWTTMPVAAEGTLSSDQMADLLAFMLEKNGFPAGEKALNPDRAALSAIRLERPDDQQD